MSKALNPGDHVPLDVTKEARERIIVGLRWDPKVRTGIKEKIQIFMGKNIAAFDMDLTCYIFDVNGRPVGEVAGDSGKSIDQTGMIYHSGDSQSGEGGDDDEHVAAELKELPPRIHSLLFVATSQSEHTFSEIRSPEIRIADAYDDRDFLSVPIGKGRGGDARVFTFCRIYRKDDGWMLHYIGDYLTEDEAEDWDDRVSDYLQDYGS